MKVSKVAVISALFAVAVFGSGMQPLAAQSRTGQFNCGRDDREMTDEMNAALNKLAAGDSKGAYSTLNWGATFFYGCAKSELNNHGESNQYWLYYQATAMTQVSAGDAVPIPICQ
jgi:hypothetical protein